MYVRNATLKIARAHARTLIPDVLELMSDGRLNPALVTSAVADFDDAQGALTEHVRAGYAKTVLSR
jgi:threonine dehydrogenase-like Zn-dependent dehydrogenase